ncbi:lipoyl domain-containing protein [Colwellia sp. E150_009]|jgi:pyruvate/2-oxoglutarate dehydrogenase complex dihydrolipoamide acyltransferase (E2) component|tara:strand:+ start:1223 stop:1456 length:234 start_codon:yes stop_codon:yes gene_type:complete
MTKAITIPMDLWEEDEEAVLTAWLVDNNSEVSTGQLLAEVMVEKISYEIHSTYDGTISITCQEDDVVNKGSIIAEVS